MGWQPSAPAGTASPRKSQSPAAPAVHARPRQRSASPAASPLRTAERPARSASNAPPPAKKACVAASARVGTLSQNGYGALQGALAHANLLCNTLQSIPGLPWALQVPPPLRMLTMQKADALNQATCPPLNLAHLGGVTSSCHLSGRWLVQCSNLRYVLLIA